MTNEEFEAAYREITLRAMALNEKARREGLLALEEEIDREKILERDVFAVGLRLVVDATDPEIVNAVLSNIVNREEDGERKTLKEIQKQAVLSIQRGDNPRFLMLKMNSFVNIGIEEAMKIFLGEEP